MTRQIRVSGRVQGVGYRAAMQDEARSAGVGGWVRNRADGTVEALLHGPADAVDALIAWARHGPPGARVTNVQTRPADGRENPGEGFELRPSA